MNRSAPDTTHLGYTSVDLLDTVFYVFTMVLLGTDRSVKCWLRHVSSQCVTLLTGGPAEGLPGV
jgi:hypothetical protein